MLYAQKPPSREIKRTERRSDGLWLFSDYGTHRLSPMNENTVRISLTREDAFSDMPRPGIVAKDVWDGWNFEESPEEVVLKTPKLRISIDCKTASFKYYDADGRLLLSEAGRDAKTMERFKKYRTLSAHTEKVETPDGVKDVVCEAERIEEGFSYHAMFNFKLSDGEAIYGLGQHEEGLGSLRGQTVYLHQANRKIAVPMMVSTLGYGILNDCYSPVIFSDTQYGTYLYSEAVPELEYYFMYGEDMHEVIAQYRFLSGKAAMLPRWAFGYIQSQEKYDDQKDVETILEGYRSRGIGLDCIVQDWCSWEDGKWGQKSFDLSRYPDPSGMIKKLHDNHVRFMISVWANSDAGCDNHNEFKVAGLFLPGQNIYNALSKEGREMYWKQLERGLFGHGVDAWWCDNSEPITPEWQTGERPEPSRMYSDYVSAVSDCLPVEQTNAFGFYHALGVYEGQRSSGSDKRVCNLTRSAYIGQQRLGTILWSGDIAATWDTLRRQIASGLNFCASGLPYWTTDIGAFFVKQGFNWYWRGDFEDTVRDPGYKEFFVRWYQWGAFLPVFRGHGTDCRRELWNFENADIFFYDALIKMNRLRYELMPYIYSNAGNCWLDDGLMMTNLAFGWPEDETAKEITDQYMFGPSLMICPVTEAMYYFPGSEKIDRPKTRRVYLPEGGWYDFWTNEYLKGGCWIEANAPIDIIPVFVKEGAVIPFAEFAQSTDEQTEDLTVHVYSGCDGEFTLYEDAFDGYGYERGEYILTDLKWNDAKKELTRNRRTRWQMSDEEAKKRYRISEIKVITHSIAISSEYLVIAYTRNAVEDYSEFLGHSIHFAVSNDSGKTVIPLYHNYGKLFPKCGFSDENGIISMGAGNIMIYKIGDEYIITAKEIRRTPLGNGEFSESETGSFVRWTTKNFVTFSDPIVTKDRYTNMEGQIKDCVSTAFRSESMDYAESAVFIPVSEAIAAALINNNITVEFEAAELPKDVAVSNRKELEEVTAKIKYTDGSVHEKRVLWKTDGVDFSKPGRYAVEGKIVTRHFDFPVENHPWGDPVITYYRGRYYWIATNDADGDTSFEIREADTPEALFDKNVRRSVILSAETSIYKNTFWAPEFHIVGGKMRIFCALTVGTDFNPQCYVMTLKDSGDMLNPDDWSPPERCVMPDGRNLCENPLGDGKNGITLDMTCFEAGKKSYAVWSYRTWTGTDSGSMLMIAENNPDKPWEMLTFPQLLSRPVYGWENNRGTDNNEGPFALVTGSKVFLAYSGGDARGQSYVVGMLTANVGDNLCDVSNWEIPSAPSLASNFVAGEYGCGHNAFFTDEYGDIYITYHGVDAPQSRVIRPGIRRVHFAADGIPILHMSNEQDLPESERNVRITLTIEP